MSAHHFSSWSDLCRSSELAFRAACNSALNGAHSPVKPRVIKRLSDSSEARELFERLWVLAGTTPGSQAENFLKNLSSDSMWQTKVAEEVEREETWNDLFNLGYFKDKVWDWIKSFSEKAGGKEHPISRLFLAATVGLTITIAVRTLKPDAITIPVKVVAGYDDSQAPSVRVNLAPLAGANQPQIPIQLQMVPDKTPVHINLVTDEGDGCKCTDIVKQISSRLDAGNASLHLAAAELRGVVQLEPMREDMSKLTVGLQSISRDVGATASAMDGVKTQIEGIKTSYESKTSEEIDVEKDEVRNLDYRMGVLAQASADQRAFGETRLSANSNHTFWLPDFDPVSGKDVSRPITIQIGDIAGSGTKRTVGVTQGPVGDPKTAQNQSQTYQEGQDILLASSPWKLSVVSIQKRWAARGTVVVRPVLETSPVPFTDLQKLSDQASLSGGK